MASVRGKKPPSFRWDVPVLVSEDSSVIKYFQLNIKQKLNTRLRNLLAAEAEKDRSLEMTYQGLLQQS